MKFKYLAFPQVDPDDLEPLLNKHGADGWRLHSCEPFVIQGTLGIGSPHYLVVMDKAEEPPRAEPPAPPTRQPIGAMAVKS